MERHYFSSTFSVLFGSLLCLLLSAWPENVISAVIDNIEIDDKSSPPQVRINFTIPLQYLNHAPASSGDELEIQLQNVTQNLFSAESTRNEQQTVTTFASSRVVPLLDASYEQRDADRGIITIRFSREVDYSVHAGADRRNITISILSATKVDAQSESPAGLAVPTQPGTQRKTLPLDTLKVIPATTTTDLLKNRYVINLESAISEISTPDLTELRQPAKFIIYTTKFPINGRIWNRLRLGFFPTRKAAQKVVESLETRYPRAWIQVASEREILNISREIASTDQRITTDEPVDRTTDLQRPRQRLDSIVVQQIQPTLPAVAEEIIAALMEEARQAVATDNHNRAIQLYTKVLQYPDNPYRKDAQEFLGVARERKGQTAHAIKEYQRYLALYPEGEGTERVKQRLVGITTAADKPRTTARGSRRADEPAPWDVYGGISQFYRRNELTTDDSEKTVTESSLSTDLDLTARRRSNEYELQSRFTGSYLRDFLSDGPGNETSVSSLYFDANSKIHGLSIRLGRQSRNTGGVLGRFDGLLAGYKMTDWLTLNAVAGYPVLSTRNSLDTDRYLYGLSADLGTFANAWDFNAFIVEQRVHDVVDRRAIGGETRYFDPVRSILTFFDYDIFYKSLNTFLFLGTWTLPDRTTINASFDYRNSPLLTTSNALQGQSVDSIDDLLNSLGIDEIIQLAEDRTGKSKTATLGVSHPFSERIQLSGDITYSNLEGTRASGGVEAIPDSGSEFFYNLQLIGSSLVTSGDISILGLRFSDTSTANIHTVSLDTRYPVNRDWRINPRIRIDYRDNNNDGSTQTTFLPSLRMDYRWHKRYRFEIEGGREITSRDFTDRTEDTTSYFFSLGYRADF